MHTPLFCGDPFKAGAVVLLLRAVRPVLINWLIVGISPSRQVIVKLSILSYFVPFFKRLRAKLSKVTSFTPSCQDVFPSFTRLASLWLHLIIDIM
jgi:hypothetical protein